MVQATTTTTPRPTLTPAQGQDELSALPAEIFSQIFSLLPMKGVARARAVSKTFRAKIDANPKHIHQPTFEQTYDRLLADLQDFDKITKATLGEAATFCIAHYQLCVATMQDDYEEATRFPNFWCYHKYGKDSLEYLPEIVEDLIFDLCYPNFYRKVFMPHGFADFSGHESGMEIICGTDDDKIREDIQSLGHHLLNSRYLSETSTRLPVYRLVKVRMAALDPEKEVMANMAHWFGVPKYPSADGKKTGGMYLWCGIRDRLVRDKTVKAFNDSTTPEQDGQLSHFDRARALEEMVVCGELETACAR